MPTFAHNCLGLKGTILRDISEIIRSREDEIKSGGGSSEANGSGSSANMRLAKEKRYESLRELTQTWRQKENPDAGLPNTLFDKAEVVVVESHPTRGARLVVYGLTQTGLREIAATL